LPDAGALWLFVVAALVLLVTPGPAVLYIVARSIDQGRLAGIVSILGIAVGTLFHVVAAAFGVSALLLSSALAFNVLRYAGAAYLLWLGLRKLVAGEPVGGSQVARERGLRRVFLEGALVNLLNPKTALFFFAFLPQFADPARGSVATQILFLGVLFVLLGMASDSVWALVAGSAGHLLRGNRRLLRVQRYLTGGVFIALGLVAALSGPRGQD